MDTVNAIKAWIAAVCGVLTALWGWLGWLVIAWIICMVLDYITGTAAALKSGIWSSKVAREGLWHKLGSIVAVIVAGILDLVVRHLLSEVPMVHVPYTVLLSPLVVMWYMITEMGSIIENAGRMGAPIPGWLRKAIASLGEQIDETGGDQTPP